jgi:hypothetical protein
MVIRFVIKIRLLVSKKGQQGRPVQDLEDRIDISQIDLAQLPSDVG